MRCPKCGAESKVIDGGSTRPRSTAFKVWRRRVCLTCAHRWNTYEIPADRLKAKPQPTT